MKKKLAMIMFSCILFAATAPALAEDVPAGKAGYDKKCAMCHGKDGVAKKMAKGAANLNDPEWQSSTTLDEVFKVISEGSETMKGFAGKLSEDEIKAISEYTLTLK